MAIANASPAGDAEVVHEPAQAFVRLAYTLLCAPPRSTCANGSNFGPRTLTCGPNMYVKRLPCALRIPSLGFVHVIFIAAISLEIHLDSEVVVKIHDERATASVET
jgi:hypothetical protein